MAKEQKVEKKEESKKVEKKSTGVVDSHVEGIVNRPKRKYER